MSWELVAIIAVVVFAGLFAWRETRLRSPSKLAKTVKTLKVEVAGLGLEVERLPQAQDFSELHDRVTAIEEKSTASTPIAMKALVDRVNVLSNDHMALKAAYDDLKNRFTKLEQGTKWKAALTNEAPRG